MEGPDLTIPLVIVILIMNLIALWLYRDKIHRHKPKSKLPDSSQEPSRNTSFLNDDIQSEVKNHPSPHRSSRKQTLIS